MIFLIIPGKENIDLIFQFAGWVLERHPEDGLKIFTEDIQEVEQLPRPKVLDYLNRTNKSLVIPYLVSMIVFNTIIIIIFNVLFSSVLGTRNQLLE